jgi:CHAD domain-containing protein
MIAVTPSPSQEGESSEPDRLSVKDYTFQSIRKNFRKSTKHESEVLEDRDLEAIHQMRVGMRRLRTALAVFSPFASLPPDLHRDVTKVSKALGNVRDLDVLGVWFDDYKNATTLALAEQKQLDTLLQRLGRERKKQFKQMDKTLNGKRYRRFVEDLQQWLDRPVFLPSAEWPIQFILPDLLMPLIGQLLLHPGWLAATSDSLESWSPDTDVDFNLVNTRLSEYGSLLHDLRKQIKRVRYQAEFFADFYGEAYQAQIHQFKSGQDLLGQLQDTQVLGDFLTQAVGRDWAVQIPSLNLYFHQQRLELWLQWQQMQQKYLKSDFREHLRHLVEHPTHLQGTAS